MSGKLKAKKEVRQMSGVYLYAAPPFFFTDQKDSLLFSRHSHVQCSQVWSERNHYQKQLHFLHGVPYYILNCTVCHWCVSVGGRIGVSGQAHCNIIFAYICLYLHWMITSLCLAVSYFWIGWLYSSSCIFKPCLTVLHNDFCLNDSLPVVTSFAPWPLDLVASCIPLC